MNDSIRIILKDQYPTLLQNMTSPPRQLYIRGKLPDKDQKLLCVIGARYPSSYGLDACRKLLTGLKGYPISIVSGLAIGLDSYSHEIALEVGLHCIGFPGSPLDWNLIHPHSSQPLARRIVGSGGALLSECGPDFEYAKWAFPSRNRYMAGISHATLVIEGRKKSGSLMTAEYAGQYNRDLMAVPGSIFSDLSVGPHKLLKDHANPATCSEDILQVLGFDVNAGSYVDSPAFKALDPISQLILKEVVHGDATIDSVMEKLGLGISDVNEKIATLEMEDVIKFDGNLLRFMK